MRLFVPLSAMSIEYGSLVMLVSTAESEAPRPDAVEVILVLPVGIAASHPDSVVLVHRDDSGGRRVGFVVEELQGDSLRSGGPDLSA